MQNFISRIGQGGGGGGGGDAGAGEMWGIDTSRVLKASTVVTSSAPFTYTATENCWARISLAAQDNTNFQVTIDGVPVSRLYENGADVGSADALVQFMLPIPLLKGQTLKATSTYNTYPGGVTIYGSKTASGESGSGGIIYSTKERLIGKWVDNKDLYERTVIFSNIAGASGGDLTLPFSGYDHIFIYGGDFTNATNNRAIPLNCPVSSTIYTRVFIKKDISAISWSTAGFTNNTFTLTVTFRYTKK